jgi:4-hydroxybenzoate polyprenyltransferase
LRDVIFRGKLPKSRATEAMLSSRLSHCLKARPSAFVSQVGLRLKQACPAYRQGIFASQLSRGASFQRRGYSKDARKQPNSDHDVQGRLERDEKKESALRATDVQRKLNDVYYHPTTGFISHLPRSWVPYAELARLDKPTGTLYLLYPCLFSTFMAASMTSPIVMPQQVVLTSALFLAGAFVMRGAGCTVNDLWDRNLDPHVERTKFRPLARGAVTPFRAITFLGAQLLVGLGILLQFPTSCLYYGIPSLLLVGTYPLAKRVTNYPQFVLGLTFSWGAIMGFPAMGIDFLSDTNALYAAAALYASCVAWTVNYDMIYAHMDIKDDVKAGIKSIALAHQHNTKKVLRGLTVVQVALLAASGAFAGLTGVSFWVGSVVSSAFMLSRITRKVNLESVRSCLYWFKAGAWMVGNVIAGGLFVSYIAKYHKHEKIEFVKGGPALEGFRWPAEVATSKTDTEASEHRSDG